MSFLTGLGSAAGGASQGIDQGAQLIQKYQAIQQGRLALDQAQKQLQADAAVFSGIGGLGQTGGGQPPAAPQTPQQAMPPGQTSVPNQPPQGAPAPAGPGLPPAAPSIPPPAAGATAPPPQQGGDGPLGQQPIDPTDPRAAVQTVMSIAQEIKSRNPNIDPQTLMLATSRIIDMSKGLAPALRQGAQVVVQQMKDATSRGNTDARVGATERGQDMQSGNVDKRIGSNEKIAAGHDATNLQRVAQSGADAMARTQANIASADQRAAQGVWSREKTAAYKERAQAASVKLRTATSALTALTNAGVKPDDPRVAKAAKDIEGAKSEMDRVNKAAQMDETPASTAAKPATGGGAPAARGPATHQLRGKPIWPQGDHWVFEDGTEAK